MNEKEKEIIEHLRRGKINISEIARELNLPISTVSDRIKKIEEKYLAKRTSLLDFEKLGYNSCAILAIKVNSEKKIPLFDFLKQQNCINSIYYTNSGYDFLVEIVCKSNLELLNWIECNQINFQAQITHYPILKIADKERFVP